jgi:Arylsulfotransferase (ASST)
MRREYADQRGLDLHDGFASGVSNLSVTPGKPPKPCAFFPGEPRGRTIRLSCLWRHLGRDGSFFTDRDGNPIWYYELPPGDYPNPVKLLTNGHMLLNIESSNGAILREVDLAGTTIREMDMGTLGHRMQAAGFDFVPSVSHHDLLPLDNGHLIVLVNFTKSFTDLPGYPGDPGGWRRINRFRSELEYGVGMEQL